MTYIEIGGITYEDNAFEDDTTHQPILTKAQAIRQIALTTFEPFRPYDWKLFPGVTVSNPLLGYSADGEWMILIQDTSIEFVSMSKTTSFFLDDLEV